jgi:hypothetical protein
MKAGGLDVVLFYYENQEHMNVGVHLSSPPTENRSGDYYVEYNGVTYYVAECTGGNWKQGWRVGECPKDYKEVSAQVIPLDGPIRVDPGQVSASFNVMESSTLSLDVSPVIRLENVDLTLKGQINPQLQSQNVTIYAKINMDSWEVVGSTLTKPDGSYEFTWQTQTGGIYAIQTSWSGDDNYTGAVSATKNAVLMPAYLLILITTASAFACVGTYASVHRSRKRKSFPASPTTHSQDPTVSGSDF